MVEISVVIATLRPHSEIECLPALDTDRDDVEVIVRGDKGISKARNEGIREATGDKLVFVDDDAVPHEDFLEVVGDLLDSHPIVAGRIVTPAGKLVSEFCTNYDQGPRGRYTTTITGCNMAFRREVFDSVGYLDENIQWGHDETEFASRALAKFPIYYSPDMVVDHACADSPMDYWKKMYRFGPADDYLNDKRGVSTRMKLLKMCNPERFFHPTLAGTAVKSVGAVIRNWSQLKCIMLGTPWSVDQDARGSSTHPDPGDGRSGTRSG